VRAVDAGRGRVLDRDSGVSTAVVVDEIVEHDSLADIGKAVAVGVPQLVGRGKTERVIRRPYVGRLRVVTRVQVHVRVFDGELDVAGGRLLGSAEIDADDYRVIVPIQRPTVARQDVRKLSLLAVDDVG